MRLLKKPSTGLEVENVLALDGPLESRASLDAEKVQVDRISGHLPKGNICQMKVAVDNKLFNFWKGDTKRVTKRVMSMVESANRIYRDRGPLLNSGSAVLPIQFHVRDLFVATNEYCLSSGNKDFRCAECPDFISTMLDPDVADSRLINNLSVSEDFSDYCVSYVFTGCYHGNTLGESMVSGACVEAVNLFGWRSSNVGFVSVYDVSDASAEWVLAHELGHSLGAHHYNQTANEGRHIMNPQVPETVMRTAEVFAQQSIDAMNQNAYNISQGLSFSWISVSGHKYYAPRRWCLSQDWKGLEVETRTTTTTARTYTYTTRHMSNQSVSYGVFWLIFIVIIVVVMKVLVLCSRYDCLAKAKSHSPSQTHIVRRRGLGQSQVQQQTQQQPQQQHQEQPERANQAEVPPVNEESSSAETPQQDPAQQSVNSGRRSLGQVLSNWTAGALKGIHKAVPYKKMDDYEG